MFDIFHDIWKNPGASFSPMPFWFWNDKLDSDELVRQVDMFHKKGIDGFVIHPRMGLGGDSYMSEEYWECVGAVLEAAKKRFMLVILYDEGMYPSGSAHGEVVREEPKFGSRKLYAIETGTDIPSEDEILYRIFVDDSGSVSFDAREGYTSYDLVLGYTYGQIRGLEPDEDVGHENAPRSADLLNPYAVQSFINKTHDRYYERFSEYFGSTVIGFFTDEPNIAGRNARLDKSIVWTYDLMEDFMEEGGDWIHLTALLLDKGGPSLKRDASRIWSHAVHRHLGQSYYAQLSQWCKDHKIALTGHPDSSVDSDSLRYFDIPGQDIVWRMIAPGTELTAPDSPAPKLCSDCTRHMGLSRNANEFLGCCGHRDNLWDFPPEEMMRVLNFLLARGTNLLIPHAFYYSLRTPVQYTESPPDVGPGSVVWKDYKKLAGYIKRMAWLNTIGTNNPLCAVLCSNDFVPLRNVEPLYRNCYTFNYLTVNDFLEKAHIHDGKILIDRFEYDILLIDKGLELTPEIVEKAGRMVVEGGKMYHGNDFASFVRENADIRTYFDGETGGNLRFSHYTKSGCPFFLFINEGGEDITGNLVTDLRGGAEFFDPFTGNTTPALCEQSGENYIYPVSVPAGAAVVIGMDPDGEPHIGKTPVITVAGSVSIPDDSLCISLVKDPDRRYCVCASSVHDRADVYVNGKDAGSLLFRPFRLDITDRMNDGENTVTVKIVGSPANTYGKPVPVTADDLKVEIII